MAATDATPRMGQAAAPAPSVWFQLRHDVDVKKQLLTICWVAVVLALFELLLFLRVIVPQVRTSMGGMLRGATGGRSLGADHPATPYARALLAALHEREAELIAATRRGAVLNGALIVALPLIVVAAMYAGSPALRAAPKRDVLWDVVVTVGAIIAFQTVFYFLGQNWNYATNPEMAYDVAREYDTEAGGVLDCAGLAAKLVQRVTVAAGRLAPAAGPVSGGGGGILGDRGNGTNTPFTDLAIQELRQRGGLDKATESALNANAARFETLMQDEVQARLGAVDYKVALDRLWATVRGAVQSRGEQNNAVHA